MKQIKKTLDIWTVEVPRKVGDVEIVTKYHFTSADAPVTFGGVQYIPLSTFDQAKWAENITETV
jgi:hypothetical protein